MIKQEPMNPLKTSGIGSTLTSDSRQSAQPAAAETDRLRWETALERMHASPASRHEPLQHVRAESPPPLCFSQRSGSADQGGGRRPDSSLVGVDHARNMFQNLNAFHQAR